MVIDQITIDDKVAQPDQAANALVGIPGTAGVWIGLNLDPFGEAVPAAIRGVVGRKAASNFLQEALAVGREGQEEQIHRREWSNVGFLD